MPGATNDRNTLEALFLGRTYGLTHIGFALGLTVVLRCGIKAHLTHGL